MLMPKGKGIVLWTLRYGDEVRDDADYFGDLRGVKPDGEALKLVSRLIETRMTDWDPKMVEDPVQDRLLELIESKKTGRKPARTSRSDEPRDSGKVVSIIDALKRSIASEKPAARKR